MVGPPHAFSPLASGVDNCAKILSEKRRLPISCKPTFHLQGVPYASTRFTQAAVKSTHILQGKFGGKGVASADSSTPGTKMGFMSSDTLQRTTHMHRKRRERAPCAERCSNFWLCSVLLCKETLRLLFSEESATRLLRNQECTSSKRLDPCRTVRRRRDCNRSGQCVLGMSLPLHPLKVFLLIIAICAEQQAKSVVCPSRQLSKCSTMGNHTPQTKTTSFLIAKSQAIELGRRTNDTCKTKADIFQTNKNSTRNPASRINNIQ